MFRHVLGRVGIADDATVRDRLVERQFDDRHRRVAVGGGDLDGELVGALRELTGAPVSVRAASTLSGSGSKPARAGH